MPQEQFEIARYIIGNIDDDGYLRLDLQSISDDIAFNYGKEIDIPELEEGLRVVQSLEPPGVGARDIRECLLLQLERRSNLTAAQVLAKRILENCFTEFTKKHFEKIMGRLGISEEQFRAAIEEIQRLSPKPGNLYNEGGNIASPYVIPDFILDERDGELMLRLNSYNVPELKINRKYADMIRQMAHSSGNPSQEDKEALQFVKNKIDSAKWFISAIKQRQDTLMRTMQAIVDYQREYFLDGNESKSQADDIERYRRYDGARRLHHLAGGEQQVRPDGIRHHLPQAPLFGGDADRQRRGGLLIRNQEHPLRVYRPGGQAQTADGRGAHGDTQQHGLPYRPAHGGQIPRDARNPGGPAPQGASEAAGMQRRLWTIAAAASLPPGPPL